MYIPTGKNYEDLLSTQRQLFLYICLRNAPDFYTSRSRINLFTFASSQVINAIRIEKKLTWKIETDLEHVCANEPLDGDLVVIDAQYRGKQI